MPLLADADRGKSRSSWAIGGSSAAECFVAATAVQLESPFKWAAVSAKPLCQQQQQLKGNLQVELKELCAQKPPNCASFAEFIRANRVEATRTSQPSLCPTQLLEAAQTNSKRH